MYIPQKQPSPEALLRFLAVSQVFGYERRGYSRTKAVELVCAEPLYDLNGRCRYVNERTLYRWLSKAKEAMGCPGRTPVLEALESSCKKPIKGSTVLSKRFLSYCKHQKELDELASVPELIYRARVEGILAKDELVDRSTVYRALKRQGVCLQRRKKSGPTRDTRRFQYPHRMQCVLCDGKHFRAGPNRTKRVALFFIDDSSRFVLDAFVAPSENKLIFLRGLFEVIQEFGFIDITYLDRGPGFIALETIEIISRFGLLIHGEKKYPQGHGKVERFNQTIFKDLLRSFDGDPTIDPDCAHLQLRIRHYLHNVYNVRPHEGIDGRTPRECFFADERELVFPENEDIFRDTFVIHLRRRVSSDNIVKVDKRELQLPLGYAGTIINLQRRMFDNSVHFLNKGKLQELNEVNKIENARSRRAKKKKKKKTANKVVKTAASKQFDKDFSPIVGPDGGYPKSK